MNVRMLNKTLAFRDSTSATSPLKHLPSNLLPRYPLSQRKPQPKRRKDSMRKYRLVAKKGEGTFSEVLKAQNVKDGRYHAIKCMKNRFESIDQVNR